MFCLETAVKLLYWCGFAYEHGEVRYCSFAAKCRSYTRPRILPILAEPQFAQGRARLLQGGVRNECQHV